MNRKFPTVDADGHLEEVHVNWKERLPQRYQAMAPERRPAGNGQSRLFIEGKAWPKPSGPGLGVGGPYSRPHPRREGMQDPKARLVDMDSEGVDVAVLFGGSFAGTIPALEDAALAIELARARNTWVAEYCAQNPSRLKGTAVLPQQDIPASVTELRRAVTRSRPLPPWAPGLPSPPCESRSRGSAPLGSSGERLLSLVTGPMVDRLARAAEKPD